MMFWDNGRRTLVFFAFLSILLAVNTVSAQGDVGTIIQNANTTFNDMMNSSMWLPIAFAVLLVTFMLTTIIYVIGYGFNAEEMKRWAKMEYMQIVATLLLLAFIVVGMAVGWAVLAGVTQKMVEISFMKGMMTTGGWSDLTGEPFAVSEIYIRNVINCEKKAYGALYTAAFFLEPLEKHSMDVAGAGDPVHGWYLTGLINLIHSAQTNLTYGLIMGYFQIELLRFIEVAMLTVFLPLGLILRTFPVTRGTGGLFIAVALGFFFVFPISYIVTLASIDYSSFCKVAETDIPNELKETSCYTSPSDITFQKGQESAVVAWTDNLVMKLHNTLFIILVGAFSMLYALIITITFIRATSYVFGSDLAEIGRGLLKLI